MRFKSKKHDIDTSNMRYTKRPSPVREMKGDIMRNKISTTKDEERDPFEFGRFVEYNVTFKNNDSKKDKKT